MNLTSKIRDVPNFPQEGIVFKDITTLLGDPAAFRYAIDSLTERYKDQRIDVVAATEARGFIFGAPLAYNLGAGFVPVRKPGKLPVETISVEYTLEYGSNKLELHRDAIASGQRVLIVDDLLATGGTVGATIRLVEELGGEIVGVAFLIELTQLGGKDTLSKYNVVSLVQV
jgi:adenine phosphoribosyltransferase